jgi:hypothetical protein
VKKIDVLLDLYESKEEHREFWTEARRKRELENRVEELKIHDMFFENHKMYAVTEREIEVAYKEYVRIKGSNETCLSYAEFAHLPVMIPLFMSKGPPDSELVKDNEALVDAEKLHNLEVAEHNRKMIEKREKRLERA